MSQAQKIRDYLAKQKPVDGQDFIPLDMDQLASAVGSTRAKATSHLSAMASVGRVELTHDPNWTKGGWAPITGFRNLDTRKRRSNVPSVASKKKGLRQIAEKKEEPKVLRRLLQTPELDRVAEARSAMREFVERFPGMVDEARATEAIRIDPERTEAYVTEGLNLIERNAHLERTNRELRERVAELERELGYKRLSRDAQLRQGLESAGVVHSND